MVEIHGERGTVWEGSAQAAFGPPGAVLQLQSLHWRWIPARLAAGRIAFQVDAAGPGLEGRLEVARGFADTSLRDVHARMQAASLSSVAPLLGPWQPEGTVTLDAPSIAWDERNARGDARIEWRDAALALSNVRPLGTYRIEVHGEGGPATIAASTVDGALRISGRGTIAPSGAWSFSGEARGEGPQAIALVPLLDRLGPLRADGARAFEWRGR